MRDLKFVVASRLEFACPLTSITTSRHRLTIEAASRSASEEDLWIDDAPGLNRILSPVAREASPAWHAPASRLVVNGVTINEGGPMDVLLTPTSPVALVVFATRFSGAGWIIFRDVDAAVFAALVDCAAILVRAIYGSQLLVARHGGGRVGNADASIQFGGFPSPPHQIAPVFAAIRRAMKPSSHIPLCGVFCFQTISC